MKFNPIPLLTTIFLLVSFYSSGQDEMRYRLQLQQGEILPQRNITSERIAAINRKAVRVSNKSFAIIQFETIPTPEQRQQLQQGGIELLDYVPRNAYTAIIKDSLSVAVLNRVKARAVVEPAPELKMQPDLAKGIFPAHAVKSGGSIDVSISFPASFSYETVSHELKKRNVDIVATTWLDYRIIDVRLATTRLKELAALPFVMYVMAVPKEDEPLNNKSTLNARANVLQSTLPGGRALRGEGVVIGIGDDADPMTHIDFVARLINRAAIAGNTHGVHVIGTAIGAGLVQEPFAGYATKAFAVTQQFSKILTNAPAYVQDHGMVITNNSYGNVASCNTYGVYDIYSRVMDQQAFQMPNLQHVFAAGNSGNAICSPYTAGFGNVLGGYQSAKNVISVGNTSELAVIQNNSSKGPVADGRIKPEITAQGFRVVSDRPVNSYAFNSGTSMSAPAVSGGLALLYQRYRQLHANADPRNGLMKALLCNGATDKGNPGPDYSYGFGWMNLLRSVIMLENNNYIHDSVNAAATKTHTITIPSGSSIAQLKVMLYWNDSAAAPLASQALVNDLDLEVTDPSAVVRFPYILNAVPSEVADTATTGPDHINNIEQVVIKNPVPGTYTFSVKGTTIPLAPRQDYFLVYDTIPVSAVLTYPVGGERLAMGDSIYISWDAYGNTANTFTVQYSTDNGGTWTTINPAVDTALRQLKWFIPTTGTDPNIITNQARIKLIHNGTGLESTSQAFTIVGVPAFTAAQCNGFITLSWTALAGATDYEIMMMRGDEMVPVGDTTGTTFSIGGLSPDSVYWVTVRARVNGSPGRRAPAVSLQPNGTTCGGSISDNDIRMETIISPASSGRVLTSTALSNNVSITVRIRNLDNAATSGDIAIAYKIGSNPQVDETIVAPNIAPGAAYDYTFTAPADMSAIGSYPMTVSVTYADDTINVNDTLVRIFRQLDNAFIDITAVPFLDDMESASVQSHITAQVGLDGLDRYDFVTTSTFGRIRTFVNTGIAYSGSKALTLDTDRFHAAGTADSLKGTFNLQGYDESTDDIRLDFQFKHHGQVSNGANRVWLRGSDQDTWIEAYNLYANQGNPGVFHKSSSIEISDLLAANGQTFTSSFQVRWGQWGQILTADNLAGAGYTFDDISLYTVEDDIQMISIDTPVVASCGLSNVTPVRITVRNSSNATITNIPVSFQADGDTPVTEIIASIAGNTSITYDFTGTADFSALGLHTLVTWVDLASDTYPDNDTAHIELNNTPVITSFPYLENFETDEGYWYSAGQNNSWEYGTPASTRINRAASGTRAWKTTLAGNYNDLEQSYLYSPCFDLTGMTSPTLSLSIALDLEDCGVSTLCDAAYVEYSADGLSWTKLGTTGAGTNWYNRNYAGNHVWSILNYARWHVATIPLPVGIEDEVIKARALKYLEGLTPEEWAAAKVEVFSKEGKPVRAVIKAGTRELSPERLQELSIRAGLKK